MKLQPKRLLHSVAGKAVVAVAVVMTGAGAAAAAGAGVGVPVLSNASTEEPGGVPVEQVDDEEALAPVAVDGDDVSHGDGVSELATSTELEGRDKGQEIAGLASSNVEVESDDDESDNGESDNAGEVGPVDEESHGAMVSEFAQSTELEGCEKGQAIAAVARGDVDPATDPDFASYFEKCTDADDDDDGEGVESDEDAETDETSGPDATDDWKMTRDVGRDAVHLAQQEFVEECGDDDAPSGEPTDETDAPMSDECRALLDAAKQARSDWKDAWHAERDAARQTGRPSGDDDTAEPDDEPAAEPDDESADVAPARPGPPDHANGRGPSAEQGNNAGGNGRGNGKP